MSLDRPLVPLGFGADTVYLNVYVTDADYQPVQKKLDPELKMQLDIWKEQAQEENEPALTSYVFDGTPLLMHDKGGTGFRWIMSNQGLTLSVNANSKMMLQARVRLSSEYLWKTRLLDLPDVPADSRQPAGEKQVHTGPRNGKYHYSPSGKKVYERK